MEEAACKSFSNRISQSMLVVPIERVVMKEVLTVPGRSSFPLWGQELLKMQRKHP